MTATRTVSSKSEKPAKGATRALPKKARISDKSATYVIGLTERPTKVQVEKIKRIFSTTVRVKKVELVAPKKSKTSASSDPALKAHRKAMDALFEATPADLRRVMKLKSAGR